MTVRHRSTTALLLAATTIGLCLCLTPPGTASADGPSWTDDGNWDGTWVYRNRELQVAIYGRTHNGLPQLKFQFRSTVMPDAFVTDWDGRASYLFAGNPASFETILTERDANVIKGTWSWERTASGDRRKEEGRFTLRRSGDGRWMTLVFEDLERTRYRATGEPLRHPVNQSWGFRKVSKRVVRWEELPF